MPAETTPETIAWVVDMLDQTTDAKNSDTLKELVNKFPIVADFVSQLWTCNAVSGPTTFKVLASNGDVIFNDLLEADYYNILDTYKGSRIAGIKMLREVIGCGLKDAIDVLNQRLFINNQTGQFVTNVADYTRVMPPSQGTPA